jgi:HJR/Mrr/RecB family endonuclease
MSRTPDKSTRLLKVAKELKVSIKTIVNYLALEGIKTDTNPNAKITSEAYNILINKYSNIKEVFVSDPTIQILDWLKRDYQNINKINPEQFENVIAFLLEKREFNVRKCGKTNESDGGIDIIAWKNDIVTIVIAIQVKYKRNILKKVSSNEVRDFIGAMNICNSFNAGMLVTNTFFSSDCKWIEELPQIKIELKDSTDIQEWLKDNFTSRNKIKQPIELKKNKFMQI